MPGDEESVKNFILNYGWTFIVILAAIAFLIYSAYIPKPEGCFIKNINCTYKVHSDKIVIAFENNLNKNITITELKIGTCLKKDLEKEFNSKENKGFEIQGCPTGSIGDKFTSPIALNYQEKETNKTGSIKGKIRATITAS